MRSKNYHSRSYHKFFEDWAEQRIIQEDGKICVERVYVGSYYCPPLNRQQRIVRRVLYVLLYVLSAAAFILSGVQDIPANHAVIPSLAAAACIFALALLLLPLYRNLVMPEEMIIRQYRAASLDLIRMSAIAAAALAAAALADLLFLLITLKSSPVLETLLCALSYLAAAGLAWILHLLERSLDYKVIPPRTIRPENSTVIKFESAQQHF